MTGDTVIEVLGGQAPQIARNHDGEVDLGLVIPTFDEAANIADLVERPAVRCNETRTFGDPSGPCSRDRSFSGGLQQPWFRLSAELS